MRFIKLYTTAKNAFVIKVMAIDAIKLENDPRAWLVYVRGFDLPISIDESSYMALETILTNRQTKSTKVHKKC